LAKILSNRTRASEILNGNRKLSLAMVRKLNKDLDIPAEVLISDYEMSDV
jgi:HTH-type transcriptional regulator/antitoxin HigA